MYINISKLLVGAVAGFVLSSTAVFGDVIVEGAINYGNAGSSGVMMSVGLPLNESESALVGAERWGSCLLANGRMQVLSHDIALMTGNIDFGFKLNEYMGAYVGGGALSYGYDTLPIATAGITMKLNIISLNIDGFFANGENSGIKFTAPVYQYQQMALSLFAEGNKVGVQKRDTDVEPRFQTLTESTQIERNVGVQLNYRFK